MTFLDELWVEYPVPQSVSVWYGDGVTKQPMADINQLVSMCVNELASDILITCYASANSMSTVLDDDTVCVNSAKLLQGFQGNRIVKVTYDASTHTAYLRYFPSTITYLRKLHVADLDTLVGDRLRYFKFYILYKMSQKELQILSAIKLDTDNGEVNLDSLRSYSNDCITKFEALKPEILMYSVGN